MSRAFVKEPDGLDAFEELPDKLISEHRNLVTGKGLAQIEAAVSDAQTALAAAQASNDRAAMARAQRDIRYWVQRQASAELQPAAAAGGVVQFGSAVTMVRGDGRRQTYTIVGEDEADPSKGTISYVSPLAQALFGKSVGDEVVAGATTAEITAVG